MTAPALLAAMIEMAAPANDRVRRDAERLAPIIVAQAAAVDPPLESELIAAVALRESWYRADVHGSVGEVGPFQISPRGLGRYLCRDLMPRIHRLTENTRCAVRLLAFARKRCGGEPLRWIGGFNGRKACAANPYSRKILAAVRRAKGK